MFFPEKIKNIKSNDYVLEIGPGGAPHPRSDVFLEKVFEDDKIAQAQRAFAPKLKTSKKVVYYDGVSFPFRDKEFEYVICSHVLEHILDIENFLKEMFRVAKKGYIEYPVIYYDYIYNFPEHLTFLKFKQDKLFYLPKTMTSLSEFSEVNKLFYESLKSEHICLIDALKKELFEGFEWDVPFKVEKAQRISDVCWEHIKINSPYNIRLYILRRVKSVIKRIIKSIFGVNKKKN